MFWGFITELKQVNEQKNFRIDIIKYFGRNDCRFSDLGNIDFWMSETLLEKFHVGTLNNRGRFIPHPDNINFYLSEIAIDPREGKCCQPFHDTNLHTKDLQYIYIDPDDTDTVLNFNSLVCVKNIHSVMENIKQLHCAKCNRQCPGFEDIENIKIRINGEWVTLNRTNDELLYDAIHASKLINNIGITLSKKFKNTSIYQLTDPRCVSSICTECEPYYQVDENMCVVPVDAQNEIVFSQESQDSQSSNTIHSPSNTNDIPLHDRKLQVNQINPLGPENLFTLNLLNNHEFECFMRSLTKAELMCISPLLLCVTIMRCRSTQIPFTKQGSIAYPLLTPMETKTLPWYDFKNLPIIVVYRDDPNEKYRSEAKVNLSNILRAKEYMETRIIHQGVGRTLNRIVSDCCVQFENENIVRLKDQLHGHTNESVIPQGIRELKITDDEEKMAQPLTKQLVRNWLKSDFKFGQAVLFSLYDELDDAQKKDQTISPFEEFWNALETFSSNSLKSKIDLLKKDSDNDHEIRVYQGWLEDGTVVTAHTITEYAESKHYLNRIENIEEYDTSYFIFEEFLILKQRFTNDLGLNQVAIGGTVDYCQDHPDKIVERNLKDTALDRRPLQPDKANPAPEWKDSYLQKAFPGIFLTGDAAFDQKRPVPLFKWKSDSKCREEYIKMLALQKGVQDKPEFIFVLLNLLKKEDANRASGCVLRDVDLTTMEIPSKEELRTDLATKKSNMLMQLSSQIRGSPQYWKKQQKESIAAKIDFEHTDPKTRPGVTPVYASLFRTRSFSNQP